MTDDNLTAEIEKAMQKYSVIFEMRDGTSHGVLPLDKAVAVCVAKVAHTKKMGRAAVEQAVEAERERCVKFMCEYVRRVYKFDPAGLAYAIRNESKPPTEPPRCGTCGGSGLSGELSYGGFAKPCPDCQKETS